jgi:hypothetical protein
MRVTVIFTTKLISRNEYETDGPPQKRQEDYCAGGNKRHCVVATVRIY